MGISGQAVLLRIFLGESDKLGHLPLYEALVRKTREMNIAGATVLKGVLGYGASDHIRTSKLLDLSGDMPMIVEIVDEVEKIEALEPVLSAMIEQAGRGGMMTLENLRVIHYKPGRK